MQVSNRFKRQILAEALRGFKLNESGLLVPEFSISSAEMDSLKTLAKDIYQINSDKEIEEIVNRVLSDNSELPVEKYKQGVMELDYGISVELEFSGNKLKLLYLGNFKFIVIEDLAQVLLPADILTVLDYHVCKDKKATFALHRQGKQYPDMSKVYCTGVLEAIKVINNEFERYPNFTNPFFLTIATSLSVVYARATRGVNGNFFEEELTEDPDALYIIDIQNSTYTVNSAYKLLNNGVNKVYQELRRGCKIVSEGAGRISVLENGKIELNRDKEGNYFFKIKQKARITI